MCSGNYRDVRTLIGRGLRHTSHNHLARDDYTRGTKIQIEKVIDRPTQTPLCGFTFATQKPLIKASL